MHVVYFPLMLACWYVGDSTFQLYQIARLNPDLFWLSCLQDVYMALQRFSFKAEHIEEAMKNTLLYGGDLHSALDWLCLNLPNGEYG